ncbi:uberolysin/carnocyclin family circular bacteriocin [Weissella minor]|uniref:uberolysin/carnocyclin family circular bacteriocin n=1 Tax=Weissella minor TaxID=1620 RepID=UPI003AF21126
MVKSKSRLVVFSMVLATLTAVATIVSISSPYLAAQFGISTYAAKKVIDIASGAGSVWAVIAIVGGSAGWGAALLAAAKVLIKRYGKKAAATW